MRRTLRQLQFYQNYFYVTTFCIYSNLNMLKPNEKKNATDFCALLKISLKKLIPRLFIIQFI